MPSERSGRGGGLRIRWLMLAILFAYSSMSYVQRTGIDVAAARMIPELGLTQDEIGWMLTAFLISYTACQFPGGVVGEIFGARRMLTLVGVLAVAMTAATALLPLALTGAALLAGLLAARFVLGVAQGPVFPICSGVVESWFPAGLWGFPQGLLAGGLNLGAAVTPPLIATVMESWGWQTALLATCIPSAAVVIVWWIQGRDTAAEHSAVSAGELAELCADPVPHGHARVSLRQTLRLLASREILLLSLSYLLMNYVFYLLTFWSFLYLVQERHFSVLGGGWLASLPFIAAALGAGTGGRVTDLLCRTRGLVRGYRIVPLVMLPIAGLGLVLAVEAEGPILAIAALCIAFAAVEMTEGGFWAATTQVAQADTMIATAVLNTGGNLGGVIGTPIVAALSGRHQWTAAFVTGAGCAVLSALLWLWIDARRKVAGAVVDEDILMAMR